MNNSSKVKLYAYQVIIGALVYLLYLIGLIIMNTCAICPGAGMMLYHVVFYVLNVMAFSTIRHTFTGSYKEFLMRRLFVSALIIIFYVIVNICSIILGFSFYNGEFM